MLGVELRPTTYKTNALILFLFLCLCLLSLSERREGFCFYFVL